MENIRKNVYPKERKKESVYTIDFRSSLADFLIIPVYNRLHLTRTLSGFLFDLIQNNVHRDV